MQDHLIDNSVSSYENSYCKMEIKDGIIFCTLTPFLEISLEIAQVLVEDRIKFSKNRSHVLLMDISNLKFIDRDAREYFATAKGVMGIKASAYIASTYTEKFLWEMFLKINKPPIPSKLFYSKKEALNWLQQYF